MEKIASFTVDHTKLDTGLYISRIDGDIVTYDIRMKKPNSEPVLENGVIHTIEHLAATYLRNSNFKDNIIYFGPMGCRTGCYLLTRGMSDGDVLALLQKTFRFIADYEGDIPGASAVECGNWLDHDLKGAKAEAEKMVTILNSKTVENMKY